MSKHTPGPWRVKYESEPGGAFLIYGPWGGAIDPDAGYVTQEENEANARLIAAAPETKRQRDELLAALELLADAYEAWGPECRTLRMAREAINSATKEEA